MNRPTELADLRAVARDADLLDALARGDATDDPAVELLASLRVLSDPTPAVVPTVAAPLRATAQVARRGRRGHWRAAVVLAAAAVVPSTGVAAAAAHPGNAFYGLHRALLGPTADDPGVPAHLLDRAEREARAAAVEDRPRATSHLVAGWSLVDQARRHLPDLHAADASALADRADRVASHLGATSAARRASDAGAHALACRSHHARHRAHHHTLVTARPAHHDASCA